VVANAVHLAELVSVRLSHDLGGLLGSLAGVLELAAENSDGATEELSLAGESAAELVLRLQLLRAAWGTASEPMDLPTLRSRKAGAVGGHRLRLDLDGLAEDTVFPAPMARLVLNVVLLAAEALPRGGVLALSGDAAGGMVALIDGPDAAWPVGFARCIADEAAAWAALGDPRHLQAPLTALIARSMGLRISLMMGARPATKGAPPPLFFGPATN
jgi:histidine phosphotransferase ChpT